MVARANGKLGGKARALALTLEQKQAIGRAGAIKRWKAEKQAKQKKVKRLVDS